MTIKGSFTFLKNIVFIVGVLAIAACRNTGNNIPYDHDAPAVKQPVSQPLVFTASSKIKWLGKASLVIKPTVAKFDYSALPSRPYDTAGFKPFSRPISSVRFDLNALPQTDLNVDKLPSIPLLFKTYLTNPPRIIKAGLPHLKRTGDGAFDFGELQEFIGSNITSLLTDRDGFLWISSDKGLYRYDGENLLLYMATFFDTAAFKMIQDDAGLLWMTVPGNGVLQFDPKTGILKNFTKKHGLNSNLALGIFEDDVQRIWVATRSGINIIDTKNKVVHILDKEHGLTTNRTTNMQRDGNDNLWITTSGGGVNVIALKEHKIKQITTANGLRSDTLFSVLCDQQNRIWLGTFPGGGINIIDPTAKSIQYSSETEKPKTNILLGAVDNSGKIWLSKSQRGLQVIDPGKGAIKSINNLNTLNGNPQDYVNTLAQDKSGRMWVATTGGLYLLKPNPLITGQIGNKSIQSIIEDHTGLVWSGTYKFGVDIIDRKTLTLKNFTTKQGLGNDTSQFITEANGQIFITSNDGFDIVDPALKTIRHFNNKMGLSNREVSAIMVDNDGRIWVGGTSAGIDIFDPRDNTLKHLGKEEGLSGENISAIIADGRNNIWISSAGGAIDVVNAKSTIIKHLNNQPGLKDENWKELMRDNNGNIWIGTYGGLYLADIIANTLTPFNTSTSLLSDKITAVLKHDSSIYVGTKGGVSVLTPSSAAAKAGRIWTVRSFGKDAGIVKVNGETFNTDMVTADGLYWWGDAGITIFDISKTINEQPSTTHITGMNIMDSPAIFADRTGKEVKGLDSVWSENGFTLYPKGQLPQESSYKLQNDTTGQILNGPYNIPVNLHLSHDQNYVQFHFARLEPGNADSTKYRYMLVGEDKQWIDAANTTSTKNYFNLSAGTYTFKVTGVGINGLWSKPDEFTFAIDPPWWKTWWAFILYAALATGIIYFAITLRSRTLKRENRLLEENIQARTRELSVANEEMKEQQEEILSQRDELSKTVDNLRAAQAQLIQSEKMASMGELTAGIAHEIQNPLNFVNNFAEVSAELAAEMKDELKNGNIEDAIAIADDIEQNLKKISHHGKRADFIVKGMLQHSRTGAAEPQLTNINALADEFLKLSYHGMRAKDKSFNAELITNFAANLPQIKVIPQDIGRVLLNMFNNAFYATQQKQKGSDTHYSPVVEVSTGPLPAKGAPTAIVITVKDNGMGIPNAIKDKIMQPFFTTKPTGEGTGLGLSLSYDIVVKGHGGTIDIKTRERIYTEFIITLPIT